MNRLERKKLETFNKIIVIASDLFKESGYEETTMEEIAEKVDISKATLYKYFSDKDSILIAYMQKILKDKKEYVENNVKSKESIYDKLNYLFETISSVFSENKVLAANYFKIRINETLRFSEDKKTQGNMRKIIFSIINEAQEKGEVRGDIPVDYITRAFQTLTRQYLVVYFSSKTKHEKDLERKYLIELFLNGVKVERG